MPERLFDAAPVVEGRRDARVRVVIFEDLQCMDCALLRRRIDAVLLPEFSAQVAFEHRDFPLPSHTWARAAAIASRHFGRIDPALAIRFRREILSELALLTPESLPARVHAFAEQNGADPDAAVQSLQNSELAAEVEADCQAGLARGVTKTPTLFIGDEIFVETTSPEELRAAIARSLNV